MARPANAFICQGCWLFRRQRVTINMLDGKTQKDVQNPANWSWWITDSCAVSPRPEDYRTLIFHLLHPPCRFVLSLVDPGVKNHLHLAIANDNAVIKAGTKLWFTVNNAPLSYTFYELKEALRRQDLTGVEPGVGHLVRMLSKDEREAFAREEEKRERGRPTGNLKNENRELVRMSG